MKEGLFKKIYDFFDLHISPVFNVLSKPFVGIFNILQIGVKILLIIAIVFSSYQYLNNVFYNHDLKDGTSFKSIPENTIDVVVLGSSHAEYSFVPGFFYEDTGLYSYVLGSACQPYEVSYEMLKEALKTQSPKMVIMEAFTAMPLNSECFGDSCYVIAQAQMSGEEKYNVINYLPEEKAKEYRNEFFNYHNDWRTVEDWSIILPENQKKEGRINESLGYVYLPGIESLPENWWRALTYKEDVEVQLDEIDVISLNNIYNLCKERGIELLLYKTPIDGLDVINQSYLHEVWKWADAHNVKYVDFIDRQKEFDLYLQVHGSSFHLNIAGAAVVTDYLAKTVKDMGIGFNHQSNELLDDIYRRKGLDFTNDYLKYETNPRLFLNRLKNSKGITVVSFNYNGGMLYSRLYNSLLSLGLNPTEFQNNQPYHAIIQDGKVVAEGRYVAEYDFGAFSVKTQDNYVTIGGENHYLESALMVTYINPSSGLISHKHIDTESSWELGEPNYIYD